MNDADRKYLACKILCCCRPSEVVKILDEYILDDKISQEDKLWLCETRKTFEGLI